MQTRCSTPLELEFIFSSLACFAFVVFVCQSDINRSGVAPADSRGAG
jgi:hypothetical protein